MTFMRRLGSDPHANGKQTVACQGCPDLWELEDGDIAVIGIDITEAAEGKLPATASCGSDERIVRVPRDVIISAQGDISRLR